MYKKVEKWYNVIKYYLKDRGKEMYKRERNKWIKHIDFIISDVICINLSVFCAYVLRNGMGNVYLLADYRNVIIIALLMHFCVTFFTNVYSGILRRGYLQEAKKIVWHNIALWGLMVAYMFATKSSARVSRITVFAFFLINCVLMYLVHTIMKRHHKKYADNQKKENLIVLTNQEHVRICIDKLENGPNKRYSIQGIALPKGEGENRESIDGVPIVARGEEIFEYACRNVVDSVYICLPDASRATNEELVNTFLTMGVEVNINVDMLGHSLPNAGFATINEAAVVTTSINQPSQLGLFAKRAIDICAGIVGSIITIVLAIFIAPAIKIADPKGPVIFTQYRVGKNGRPFKFYKFRSMYSDAEERKKEFMSQNKMDGLMFKLDADPRIIGSGPDGTKKGLGHFLRASSLDEFPNFFSILKGDMSLVGTRPPTMDEYEKYELHHKSRLAIKPGLTGMWQVSGRSDMTDFEEIVKLDTEYIKNWSMGLDLRIIFKTVWVVFARKGSQ